MKYLIFAIVLTTSALVCTTDTKAQDKRAERTGRDDASKAIQALLRRALDAGSLPPGVVVRVDAFLWKSDGEDRNLAETWEFTADQVHRAELEKAGKGGEKSTYSRTNSVPFDSKEVCKILIDEGIVAVATQEGMGESMQFVGTDFDLGHRSIEILIEGKSVLWVGESCAIAGYQESNAYAFAALYEQLSSKARAATEAE